MKSHPDSVTVSFGVQITDHDRLNTLYSLLLAGKENCVGEATKVPEQDTFKFEPDPTPVKPDESDKPEPEPEPQSKLSRMKRLLTKLDRMFNEE